jgi:hypothetical protein
MTDLIEEPKIIAMEVNVSEVNVSEVNVSEVNVSEVNVSEVNVSEVDEVNVSEVNVSEVNLNKKNIIKLENETDNATLALFSNPLYLSMINRKLLNQSEDIEHLDVKFYRKRLVSLFKDMIKGESPTTELKEVYTSFIIKAIHYFEIIDKKDIIQGQHLQGQHLQGQSIQGEEGLVSPDDILNAIDISNNMTISEANDLMMRKTINVANLNNYVITKQDASSNADTRIIPMKIEIDLKASDLKTKGVKPKFKKKKEDLSK